MEGQFSFGLNNCYRLDLFITSSMLLARLYFALLTGLTVLYESWIIRISYKNSSSSDIYQECKRFAETPCTSKHDVYMSISPVRLERLLGQIGDSCWKMLLAQRAS